MQYFFVGVHMQRRARRLDRSVLNVVSKLKVKDVCYSGNSGTNQSDSLEYMPCKCMWIRRVWSTLYGQHLPYDVGPGPRGLCSATAKPSKARGSIYVVRLRQPENSFFSCIWVMRARMTIYMWFRPCIAGQGQHVSCMTSLYGLFYNFNFKPRGRLFNCQIWLPFTLPTIWITLPTITLPTITLPTITLPTN